MDGYAARGDARAGTEWTEVAEIAAGDSPDVELEAPTDVVAIMTGGWVPAGADRVVPFENTTTLEDKRIRLDRPVTPGANIRRRGEVYAAGQTLVEAGTILDPVHLALAASEGQDRLSVNPLPQCGVLVTGDEVRRGVGDGDLPAGALLDSHTPMIEGLCRGAGLDLRTLGVADDRSTDLTTLLAVDDVDVLITTGGVSAGRHDLVPGAVEELGFEIVVHRVGMQPGKPILVAARDRPTGDTQWLVGLPGNPAAVLVGFHLFVVPLARSLSGLDPWHSLRRTVELEAPVEPHALRTRYVPAMLTVEPPRGRARPGVPVGSHDLRPFAGADVLLELEPGDGRLTAGAEVEAIRLIKRL